MGKDPERFRGNNGFITEINRLGLHKPPSKAVPAVDRMDDGTGCQCITHERDGWMRCALG